MAGRVLATETDALEKRATATVNYLVAPLVTTWTAPPSCLTPTPTLVVGFCDGTTCSVSPTASWASKLSASGAYVAWADYTTSATITSAECMPPGYQFVKGFHFTGPMVCPTGWTAALNSTTTSTTTWSSTTGTWMDTFLWCCPSQFPSFSSRCYTDMPVSAGYVFSLEASGNVRGGAKPLTDWGTHSVVGTTAWPEATHATVEHQAVWIANYGTAPPSPAADAGFHLGSLTAAAAIGVLAVGVLVLLALCGCAAVCFRARRSRSVSAQNKTEAGGPMAPTPVVFMTPPQGYVPSAPQGYPPPQGQYPPPMYSTGQPNMTGHQTGYTTYEPGHPGQPQPQPQH